MHLDCRSNISFDALQNAGACLPPVATSWPGLDFAGAALLVASPDMVVWWAVHCLARGAESACLLLLVADELPWRGAILSRLRRVAEDTGPRLSDFVRLWLARSRALCDAAGKAPSPGAWARGAGPGGQVEGPVRRRREGALARRLGPGRRTWWPGRGPCATPQGRRPRPAPGPGAPDLVAGEVAQTLRPLHPTGRPLPVARQRNVDLAIFGGHRLPSAPRYSAQRRVMRTAGRRAQQLTRIAAQTRGFTPMWKSRQLEPKNGA